MKHNVPLTLALLLTVSSSAMVLAQNIIRNSDFTQRSVRNRMHPVHWHVPKNSGWFTTNEDGHSGNNALRYESTEARIVNPVVQLVKCKLNTQYILSAWFKSDGRLKPLVRVVLPNSQRVLAQVISDGSNQWLQSTARFNSGNARQLLVQIFPSTQAVEGKLTPPGRINVDDVQIIPATEMRVVRASHNETRRVPQRINIALGRPYTLWPRPNYSYCTDPDDIKQLTDGQYTVGYFWTQLSTVGWSRARPVIITIDLGEVQPICGVSYNTAAGTAGVQYPLAIYIFVSDDGKEFYYVGELITLSAKHGSPPKKGYAVHRFWTDQLKTHGRYISLVISGSPYIFVDEIEVYKGDPAWINIPFTGTPVSDLKAFFQAREVKQCVQRRLRNDVQSLRKVLKRVRVSTAVKRRIENELTAIERELPNLPDKYGRDFRAVLPLNHLHERLFRTQAMLWRAMGCAPLTVWQSGLWDSLSHVQPPPLRAKATVRVTMMLNEYRAGAFNISNAGDKSIILRMRITGLPGGVNPSYIAVHEVAWTDTKSGIPVAAALPYAQRDGDAFLIHVPSGMTRQVWLTFHPTDVKPGSYRGSIILSTDSITLRVPVVFKLFPMRFPDQPTLHLGGWDYTDADSAYDITPANRELVIRHLREHFVDSPWGTAAVLPSGQYDAHGNMIAEPDTTRFDKWLQRWRGARQYCVFASVGSQFAGSHINTPLFVKKVKAWITFWARHMQRRGLKPEQLVILLVDEPSRPQQDEVILAWAKAIRAANTGVKIWEDPVHADPAKANQEMMAVCHVLCPNRIKFLTSSQSYRDYFIKRRQRGTELAFYSCSGPVRLLDPYSYHRLQAWTCWQYGATASYFWSFGDSGRGSSWNEYAAERTAYVPFFLDATSVTPGKHMEAIREGVEDYEYLVILRNSIAEAQKRGIKGRALKRAKKLLAEAPKRVCNAKGANAFRWLEPKDRSIADRVRVRILEAVQELMSAK